MGKRKDIEPRSQREYSGADVLMLFAVVIGLMSHIFGSEKDASNPEQPRHTRGLRRLFHK